MTLKVGIYTSVTPVTETELLSYTASAGDFIRGWSVYTKEDASGLEGADITLQVDNVVKDHMTIKDVSALTSPEKAEKRITPIALAAAEVVTIDIEKLSGATASDYLAVLD